MHLPNVLTGTPVELAAGEQGSCALGFRRYQMIIALGLVEASDLPSNTF